MNILKTLNYTSRLEVMDMPMSFTRNSSVTLFHFYVKCLIGHWTMKHGQRHGIQQL